MQEVKRNDLNVVFEPAWLFYYQENFLCHTAKFHLFVNILLVKTDGQNCDVLLLDLRNDYYLQVIFDTNY